MDGPETMAHLQGRQMVDNILGGARGAAFSHDVFPVSVISNTSQYAIKVAV